MIFLFPGSILLHMENCKDFEVNTVETEQKKIPVRTVDTRAYLGAIKDMVQEGRDISITITGGSMTPFLVHGRDRVMLSKITQPLKTGDMVLYQRESGQYVMHRIRYIKKQGTQYYMIGDAQTVTEGPLKEEQIVAVVTAVCRKGKWLKPGDFWWEFFRKVWLHVIPLRRPVTKIYAHVSGRKKGRNYEN